MTYSLQNRFTETQRFATWVYGILLVVTVPSLVSVLFATAKAPALRWLLPADALIMALVINLLCLRTIVTNQELIVTLGALFPLYRRRIALADIASFEAVTYAPITEYGGWGIKGRPGNSALNARGNRGVRLTLCNGKRLLIGSQKPDALAEALTEPR